MGLLVGSASVCGLLTISIPTGPEASFPWILRRSLHEGMSEQTLSVAESSANDHISRSLRTYTAKHIQAVLVVWSRRHCAMSLQYVTQKEVITQDESSLNETFRSAAILALLCKRHKTEAIKQCATRARGRGVVGPPKRNGQTTR